VIVEKLSDPTRAAAGPPNSTETPVDTMNSWGALASRRYLNPTSKFWNPEPPGLSLVHVPPADMAKSSVMRLL